MIAALLSTLRLSKLLLKPAHMGQGRNTPSGIALMTCSLLSNGDVCVSDTCAGVDLLEWMLPCQQAAEYHQGIHAGS